MPEKSSVEIEPEVPDVTQEVVEIPAVAPTLSTEDQLASRIREDFEKLYGSRIKQLEDGFRSIGRLNTRLQQENETLRKPLPASAPGVAPAKSDPWEGIQDGSTWKSEVKRIANEEAAQLLRQIQSDQLATQQLSQHQTALASSKQQVVTKYPDLHPETGTTDSVVARPYTRVLQEHPDWLTNPYGPLLAMYAMEETLKTTPTSGTPNGSRAMAASLPTSQPTTSANPRLTLTREQKAFCDRNQLKYDDYARVAQSMETTNSVEL